MPPISVVFTVMGGNPCYIPPWPPVVWEPSPGFGRPTRPKEISEPQLCGALWRSRRENAGFQFEKDMVVPT